MTGRCSGVRSTAPGRTSGCRPAEQTEAPALGGNSGNRVRGRMGLQCASAPQAVLPLLLFESARVDSDLVVPGTRRRSSRRSPSTDAIQADKRAARRLGTTARRHRCAFVSGAGRGERAVLWRLPDPSGTARRVPHALHGRTLRGIRPARVANAGRGRPTQASIVGIPQASPPTTKRLRERADLRAAREQTSGASLPVGSPC